MSELDFTHEDVTALRSELASVKERQEILADALETAALEFQKLREENARLRAMIEYEGLDPDYRGGPKT